MLRTGFRTSAPARDADRVRAVPKPVPGAFRVAVPVTGIPVSAPKTEPKRNNSLLKMARNRPCLLCIPVICTHGTATTVACHSNLSIHGKAGARKADDCYTVWGCSACHAWLDQGPAPKTQKAAAFMRAHLAQVLEWRAIVSNGLESDGARRAAQWALDQLNATPTNGKASRA
jgi:hypothetical protein